MGIDIRARVQSLLDQYGHSIVYIRRDLRFQCDCYSERSGSARTNCPKCLGTGYYFTAEKMQTRRQLKSPDPPVFAYQNSEQGIITPTTYLYYMAYDTNPKSGDLILEVDWQDNLPIKIREKLLISVVDEKRGLNGRIEFYEVYCRYQPKGSLDHASITPD